MLRTYGERAGWSAAEIARATTSPACPLPIIDFVSEATRCPTCGAKTMGIRKTRTRVVATWAAGVFRAREHLRGCDPDHPCALVGSRALTRLVPSGQKYGYDLIVHVGLRRYLGGKQRREIVAQLWEHKGIELSEATVTRLCDRFLIRLEMLHLLRAPHLRAALDGMWSLHVDATCEKGYGGLLIVMDGFRGWVLGAARIATERGEYIQPLVDETVELFGDPLATVRDLGEAMATGVRSTRERGIPDLVCHQHFLNAVGKKLLESAHSRLRTMLQRCRLMGDLRDLLGELKRYRANASYVGRFGSGSIRNGLPALVLWCLEGEGHKEMPFPFSLHYRDLVRRCQAALSKAESWGPAPRTSAECKALQRLGSIVRRTDRDHRFADTLRELDERWNAFGELRGILRLSHSEMLRQDVPSRQLDLAVVDHQRLKAIERDIKRYRKQLRQNVPDHALGPRSTVPEAIILRYLDRYGDHLVGHPVVRDEDGTLLAVVHRTNNPPEYFFGDTKQRLRRRVGRAQLRRDMQQQPAQAALAMNLRYSDYVRVLCGSLENLPAAFADLQGQSLPNVTLKRDHRDAELQGLIHHFLEMETRDQQGQMAAVGA